MSFALLVAAMCGLLPYDGQAKRIRAYRKRLGLGRKPFCQIAGIPLAAILGEWGEDREPQILGTAFPGEGITDSEAEGIPQKQDFRYQRAIFE